MRSGGSGGGGGDDGGEKCGDLIFASHGWRRERFGELGPLCALLDAPVL